MPLNSSPCQNSVAHNIIVSIRRAANICRPSLLPEGGVIRKLWVGETAKYRDHILRLDPESRRNRFAGGVSDDFIGKYVELANSLDSVVYGFFIDNTMRGAAELRPLGMRFAGETEAAISVEKRWQSHGVGSALLSRILLTARNRGYRHMHMACMAENQRMQQLARKFDAELTFDFESVVGEVESSRPTPMSLMREFMSDSHGFATAMLDLQTRILRA
jgi:GNAT superfamily N-acetyltransferase